MQGPQFGEGFCCSWCNAYVVGINRHTNNANESARFLVSDILEHVKRIRLFLMELGIHKDLNRTSAAMETFISKEGLPKRLRSENIDRWFCGRCSLILQDSRDFRGAPLPKATVTRKKIDPGPLGHGANVKLVGWTVEILQTLNRVILGLHWAYIRVILGLYWGYIGIMEKKMETITSP